MHEWGTNMTAETWFKKKIKSGDLFHPLGWGSAWVCHKLGNAPVLQSGTGS